jgi:hypothetical protein
MDFTDLQMTLTVMVILTAAVVAVFIDHRRKEHDFPRPQRVQAHIYSVAHLPRPDRMYDNPPLEFAPARTVQLRVRETVTVEMASPSPAAPSSVPGPVAASSQQPHGMIQQPALDALLESNQPFTGLAVSIGINDSDSSMWHRLGLMPSVGNYIAGLLGEKDLACRTAYDEFVMVCQGEQGAQSRRRLNQISQRLWDYQLRGIGACSILFSWGAVQVKDQPLSEALASAAERMRETKRISNSPQSVFAHRHAV